ncbi:MAG: hypothetical protein Q8927_14305 [Bacteroidota bacterium]|nr:hypothetical protein [Bacteroidota bacterium]MDP4217371.1 hypothetical protein [Bacteroidota bacterium]MDP4247958.1 hypothetical protein [Bacteroidota bacterium]MDP4252847.1 hypothetical protein [Bacteroidota bacterium]MDP4259839.1 hypothetical protein [Bacteroidota bacterium]
MFQDQEPGSEGTDQPAKAKNLGVWMDHANAHLMEFTTVPITTKIISSRYTREEKEQNVEKGENLNGYYKRLGEIIRNYEDVILFGPTSAKSELLNILRADHYFEKIKIEVEQTDKMTQNQQHAFVRDYFSKHLL